MRRPVMLDYAIRTGRRTARHTPSPARNTCQNRSAGIWERNLIFESLTYHLCAKGGDYGRRYCNHNR
jgi:hypothetical protein